MTCVDLRTAEGMVLAWRAIPFAAIEADGPVLARAGGVVVFLVPTGVPLPWSPTALEPFLTLPKPEVSLNAWGLGSVSLGRRRRSGNVQVRLLPRDDGLRSPALLVSGEEPLGQVVLEVSGSRRSYVVGERALREGLLVGRYEGRCLGADFLPESVSRVHALLVLVRGRLLLVDVGSTNGIYRGWERVVCGEFEGDQRYRIGADAWLSWTPADAGPRGAVGPGLQVPLLHDLFKVHSAIDDEDSDGA